MHLDSEILSENNLNYQLSIIQTPTNPLTELSTDHKYPSLVHHFKFILPFNHSKSSNNPISNFRSKLQYNLGISDSHPMAPIHHSHHVALHTLFPHRQPSNHLLVLRSPHRLALGIHLRHLINPLLTHSMLLPCSVTLRKDSLRAVLSEFANRESGCGLARPAVVAVVVGRF